MKNKEIKAMEKLFGKAVIDKPDKGFYTRMQIQKKWNISASVISRILINATKNNHVEMRMYRVTIGQVTRPTPHYKILTK